MVAVIDSQYEVLKVLSEMGITPRGVQVKALENDVLDGTSLMVCSPTGSGKTLVGEMALLRAVFEGDKGIYLVPLRALAAQVAAVLQERYSKLNISVALSTGDYYQNGSELGENDIIVMTYERADSIIRHKTPWLSKVSTIVIDEIQNLSYGRRGSRLESLILRLRRLRPEAQIVALSATIDSPTELAEWLGCRLIIHDERPVPLIYKILTTSDRKRLARDLVMTTVQSNGQLILFNRTRREAESMARYLAPEIGRQLTQLEKAQLNNEINGITHWDSHVPAELMPLLHEGVAFHHAGIDSKTRRMIEDLFEQGLLKVISATTTLAAGMNLPARTVILTNVVQPNGTEQLIPTNLVHQMLGRAGRPGKDKKGFGIILAGSRGEAERIRETYFASQQGGSTPLTPKYEPIRSCLNFELTDQLLVALDFLGESTLDSIEHDFFGDSFLTFSGVRDVGSPVRIMELGEITALKALERHCLSSTLTAAREGVLGTVEIREVNNTVIGGIVSGIPSTSVTCRFSIRTTAAGTIEGPSCSCGTPIDERGILCPHLVSLGVSAIRQQPATADYILPLALSESSPARTLIRMGLVEGTIEGRLRVTHLGRLVNRLYLKIDTFREMMAMLPLVEDNTRLLWLLHHLVQLESGKRLDLPFDHLLGLVVTTTTPLPEIAREFSLSFGDLIFILENAQWLLYCIAVIAKHGRLTHAFEAAYDLKAMIDERLGKKEELTHD